MGSVPNLPVKQSIYIGTMLNFDSDVHRHGDDTCKQTLRKFCMFTSVGFLLKCAIYKTNYTRLLLGYQNIISPEADPEIVFGNPGNMNLTGMPSTGFPLGLENLEKWKIIFRSGKSQGILNKLEKSGKLLEKLLFQANFIYYF